MSAKVAKEKVWRTKDNKLVEDGHEEAQQLVARRGELISDDVLKDYSGVNNFFVSHDSKAATDAQQPVKDTRKPMTRDQIEQYRDARDDNAYTGKKATQAPEEKDTRPHPNRKTRSSVKKVSAKK